MTARYNRKQILDFPWSPLQEVALQEIAVGSGNIVIEAVAGSGKTKTAEGLVASIPSGSSILVVAFNRSIVQELKRRIPASVATVSTAHRIGKMLIVRHFNGKKISIEDDKYRRICRLLLKSAQPSSIPQTDIQARNLQHYFEQLVHFTQVNLTPLTIEEIDQTAQYYAIESQFLTGCSQEELQDWIYPLVIKALQIGEKEAAQQRFVGLDDLLWLPELWNISPPAKQYVIADEAQDASAAIAALYQRMAGTSGRIVLLGDEKQSISGFAGALPDAWARFKTELNPTFCPLHVCYRCPTAHLDLARYFVPQIQPRLNAATGTIEVLSFDQLLEKLIPGDLILCRFNAPLVQACLRLIKNGIKAQVRGKNMGQTLITLAEDAIEGKSFPEDFAQSVKGFVQNQVQNRDGEAADLIEDASSALLTCFENFGNLSEFTAFCDRIKTLFCDDDDHPAIVLSSIHRAKGDQAHRVAILGSNLLPYTASAKQNWQHEQEHHLTYVALTRCLAESEVQNSGTLFLVPISWNEFPASGLDHPYGGMRVEAVPFVAPSLSTQPVLEVPAQTQLTLF